MSSNKRLAQYSFVSLMSLTLLIAGNNTNIFWIFPMAIEYQHCKKLKLKASFDQLTYKLGLGADPLGGYREELVTHQIHGFTIS